MDYKNLRVIFITVPDEPTASKVAQDLVSSQAAACVNIIPGIQSVYRWEGRIESAGELLLMVKTTAERYPEVEMRVKALHPYKVPEIIACTVDRGLDEYCTWIKRETASMTTTNGSV